MKTTSILQEVAEYLRFPACLDPVSVTITRLSGELTAVKVAFGWGDFGSVGCLADDLGLPAPNIAEIGDARLYCTAGAARGLAWDISCVAPKLGGAA